MVASKSVIRVFVLLFTAAIVSGPTTGHAQDTETEIISITPEAASLEAARTGNVEEMRRLRGSSVQLRGEMVETLRDTKGYVDIVVLTGPDFQIAGGESGFEIVVRIPATLRAEELPPLIDASGQITDFEPRRMDERLHWRPVVTIDFLR